MSKIVLTILELAVSKAYVFGFQKLFTSDQCSLSAQARFFDSSERSLAAAEKGFIIDINLEFPEISLSCESMGLYQVVTLS